jgi:hypothetical protein
VDQWRIILRSKERILSDVLDKTGAHMIRPRYINELKGISTTHKVDFKVQSPEGINKLPSSFVVVELEKAENKMPLITGLFEYSYGAIRLVALDNEELVQKNADDIIAFFEAPLQRETGYSVRVYEAKNKL